MIVNNIILSIKKIARRVQNEKNPRTTICMERGGKKLKKKKKIV